ncbi:MAG: hypothetical protein EBU70_12670, partial [Actinobacteria bacterium]|nr:hypothetical protein [Actinomycetota bacterium]
VVGVRTCGACGDAWCHDEHRLRSGLVVIGLATALSMLVPAPTQTFLLPVWLAMSQTMGVGALAYVVGEKRPRLTRRATLAGAAGWLFWTGVLLGSGFLRTGWLVPWWFDPARLWIPAVIVAVGAVVGFVAMRGRRGLRAADALLHVASLWKSLVVSGWLLAAGLEREAIAIAAIALLLAASLALVRAFGPALLEPVGWRS